MLASATPGATICYTTDGVTTPVCDAANSTCTTGTAYSAAIAVPADTTIRAVACKADMIDSPLALAAYTIDTTAPVISAVSPAPASYAVNTQVSYTFSEACASASITWTRTGGSADGASPHVQALVGAELTAGAHNNVTLTNSPTLVDGAVYSIAFNCTDAAGNAATPVTVAGVTFDATPPTITGVAPTTGSFVNHTQVSYTLSENCASGTITWTRTDGSADGASPHVQALIGAELTAGAHNNITISNNPTLASGAIYSVKFDCTDAAGNAATPVTMTGVTYDNVVPVISAVAPASNAFVNTTAVSYTLSENCASASITWTRTGGSADPGSPHVRALVGGELNAGTHSNVIITNNPTLVDGAIYSIAFACSDPAGNAAAPVTRTNITFDPSAVVISGVAPASSSYRNNTQVSYTFSEACASASITWTRTGGNSDPSSPHVRALVGAELAAGAHNNITLTNNPVLVDGAVYSVQFDCTDFASNASTPITVTNVTYDFTAPVISSTAPPSNAFVNHTQVDYTLSEDCASASITWTHTGGVADGASPHVKALLGAELNAGAHTHITITNNPTLVDGAVYSIAFNCADAAGNLASTVTNTSVTYDITQPTVSISNLKDKSTVNTGYVIGIANDNVGVTQVMYNLDNTAWNNATYTAPDWKFALPTGASTWRDRTQHTIQVRAYDATGNLAVSPTINVRKGNNRDVNGDGYEDVAIGAWAYSSSTGRAYVFYGGPSGITISDAASAPRILTGAANSNYFGRAMTMADFNGDGFGDLAVSAYGNNSNQGRVDIYHGSATGIGAVSNSNFVGETSPTATSRFGSLLVAGDTNNDGYADVVVAANSYDSGKGKAYLFHGAGTGFAGGNASSANRTFLGEGNLSENFSGSMVLGDFNGDGLTDLAISAPSAIATLAGRVYIIYGTASGIPTTTVSATDAIGTGGFQDSYGGGLAAGDINGDGITDLVVGAYGYSAGGNTGRAGIYHGSASGIPANQTSTPGSPATVLTGTNTGAFFTTNSTVADFNNDGFADVLVGSYGCSANTAGCAYLFNGSATGISSGLASSATITYTGQTASENFGRAVGFADVNGDGYLDAVVGANFYSSNSGRAFIFPGSSAGPSTTASSIISGEGSSEFGIHVNR